MTIEKKDLVEAIESSQTDPTDKVQTYLRNLLVDFVRSWPDSKLVLPGNLYSRKQMLSKRNPHRQDVKDDFERFATARKQWEADIKAGNKTMEEYHKWLLWADKDHAALVASLRGSGPRPD